MKKENEIMDNGNNNIEGQTEEKDLAWPLNYMAEGLIFFTVLLGVSAAACTPLLLTFYLLNKINEEGDKRYLIDQIKKKIEIDKVGEEINNKYFYQDEDMYDMYYVVSKDINENYSTHIVKEVNIEDFYSYDEENGLRTYGQYYVGEDYRRLFGNNLAENGNSRLLDAKLYIDAIDNSVVSVVKSSLFSETDTLLGTLFTDYNFNIGSDLSKSACAFRYNSIVNAKSMFDCLEYIENDNSTLTTEDLIQIKDQLDNPKEKQKVKKR